MNFRPQNLRIIRFIDDLNLLKRRENLTVPALFFSKSSGRLRNGDLKVWLHLRPRKREIDIRENINLKY